MKLDLGSATLEEYGGFVGDGNARLIAQGNDLSPLALAMREAVQNSWDARTDKSIEFRVEYRDLSESEIRRIENDLFVGAREVRIGLHQALLDSPGVLTFTDLETFGLDGPLDKEGALKAAQLKNRSTRFRNFLFYVGKHDVVARSGGTHGFGKSTLFQLSGAGAIAVLTRARPSPEAPPEARFICAAVGNRLVTAGAELSGWHWWGRKLPGTKTVTALTGAAAERAGEYLGLEVPSDATGTAIAIIAPRPDAAGSHFDRKEIGKELSEIIQWQFWPKMLGEGPSQQAEIRFSAKVNGGSVVIGNPAKHTALKHFVDSYRVATSRDEPSELFTRHEVTCDINGSDEQTGIHVLKRCSIKVGKVERNRHSWEPLNPLRLRHTCLLRAPRLVVEYKEGTQDLSSGIGYAGVFIASEKHERFFAESEPAAHNEWIHSKLTGDAKNAVKRTLQIIIANMQALGTAVTPTAPSEADSSMLGGLSTILGDLLSGIDGDGAGRRRNGIRQRGVTPHRRASASVRALQSSVFERAGDRTVVKIDIEIEAEDNAALPAVRATVKVLSGDGGGVEAGEAPEGGGGVVLLHWIGPDGQPSATGGRFAVTASMGPSPWQVALFAEQPVDAGARFAFRIEDEGVQ